MPSASIASGIEEQTKSVESRQLLLVLASPPSERCTGLHDHGRVRGLLKIANNVKSNKQSQNVSRIEPMRLMSIN